MNELNQIPQMSGAIVGTEVNEANEMREINQISEMNPIREINETSQTTCFFNPRTPQIPTSEQYLLVWKSNQFQI